MLKVMRSKRLCLWLCTLATSSLWAFDLLEEGPAVDYVAMREISSDQGSVSMKEYYAGGDRRLEMAMGGQSAVVIYREQDGKSFMLMPDLKMYMEMPSSRLAKQTGQVKVKEQKKVGSEILDGHKVDKYQSTFEDADGNRGEGFYWITPERVVLKMTMTLTSGQQRQAFEMRLTDLRIGKQPASLFALPTGYTAVPATGGAIPGMTQPGAR